MNPFIVRWITWIVKGMVMGIWHAWIESGSSVEKHFLRVSSKARYMLVACQFLVWWFSLASVCTVIFWRHSIQRLIQHCYVLCHRFAFPCHSSYAETMIKTRDGYWCWCSSSSLHDSLSSGISILARADIMILCNVRGIRSAWSLQWELMEPHQ